MKILWFFLVGVGFQLCAQDFERVDAVIQLYPTQFNKAEELAYFIQRDFKNEEEQVRALFGWLINNVAYHPEEYKKFNYTFKNYRERNKKEEITRQKIIKRTLQKGIAVCEGYAFVFEKVCTLLGIENYLIQGDTKSTPQDIGRSFKVNHVWNTAKINGQWQLFDATWGAGKYREKFIKEPSYFYFNTPPQWFVHSHYPTLIEDTMLNPPPSLSDFKNAPLIINNYFKINNIITPKTGVILKENDYETFNINAAAPQSIQYSYGGEKVEISFTQLQNSIQFKIPIEKIEDYLFIYFEQKIVMAFKIE